jgi:hypothetical protein
LEENISSEAAQKILKGSKRGFTSITAFKKAVDNSIEDAKETPKGSEGPTLDQQTTEGGMQEETTEGGGKAIVSVLAEATTEEVVMMLSECFSEAKLLEIAKQLSLLVMVSKDDLQKAA